MLTQSYLFLLIIAASLLIGVQHPSAQTGLEERGWLGISFEEVAQNPSNNDDDSTIVVVTDLLPGPAFDNGVQPGDIIFALDSFEVSTEEEFLQYIDTMKPNENIKLWLLRDNRLLSVEFSLERRNETGRSLYGIFPSFVSNSLVVSEIDIRSLAYRSGARRGDVILRAGLIRPENTFEIMSEMEKYRESGRRFFPLRLSNGEVEKIVYLLLSEDLWELDVYEIGPIFSVPSSPLLQVPHSPIPNYFYLDWLTADDWTIHFQLENGHMEIWDISSNGSVLSHVQRFPRGDDSREPRIETGRYRIDRDRLCFTFNESEEERCGRFLVRNSNVYWSLERGGARVRDFPVLGVFRTADLLRESQPVEPLSDDTLAAAATPREVAPNVTKPRACTRISSYCSELALKSAACGWVGQEAADRTFGETGRTGGAAAGATCQALLADADGLPIDFLDLVLAASSSAFLEGAQQSFEDGDYLSALVEGLFGVGVGAVGIAKCENTLQRACR